MPVRPEMRHHYTTPEWRALSLKIRKERAKDRCECTGECGTDHFAENVRGGTADDIQPLRGLLVDGDRCSALEGRVRPGGKRRVRLTVAHIDQDPANNDDGNLLALCERCHNRLDMPFRRLNAAKTRRRKKAADDLLNPGIDRR